MKSPGQPAKTSTRMKVKELFKKMATRAGIAETDAKLIAALDALPDVDVDDEAVANPLTQNLISEAEAENRPKIKSKYTAEALNGIDALVDPLLADIFSPEELETFKTENKATTKKIAKLLEKAKTLKQAGGNQGETAETIRKLNEEITKIKSDKDTEVSSLVSKHQTERYYDRLATRVIGRNDVTDYAKAKDGRRVMDDLRDTLDSVGGVLDIATGKVMDKKDTSLELFIDNKAATVDGLLQKTLDDNGYIKKSDPAKADTVITTTGDQPAAGQMTEAQRRNAERLKSDE